MILAKWALGLQLISIPILVKNLQSDLSNNVFLLADLIITFIMPFFFFLDDKMKAEVADFEIGKRHLANIMGEDPDSFTQVDVDVSVSRVFYLYNLW